MQYFRGDNLNYSVMLEATLELVLGFFGLLFITRLLGKTQLSQITPFYFISALVLGELLGNAVYDDAIDLPLILYTLILWAALIYLVEIITQKFSWSRVFFEGEPSIIIRNGKIDYNQLKKDRLDISEMMSMLRCKDAFSVEEVQYAILEPNGSLSIMKKPEYQCVSREDMKLPKRVYELPIVLIFDREINDDHLTLCGLNRQWLMEELKKQGVHSEEQVIYAEYTTTKGLYINTF